MLKECIFNSCYGQISLSVHQGEFWLSFGEMQIWLCRERLRQFARKTARLISFLNQPARPNRPLSSFQKRLVRQPILTPPGQDGVEFVFSMDELLDLEVLLNGALVMIDLREFLLNHHFTVED
jgi:hypothetical protein